MIEREVKIRVTDLAAIRQRLESLGAHREGVENEVNRILDSSDGALQRKHQVLRVRTAGKSTFTWKGQAEDHDPFEHKTREEIEVQFSTEGTEELLGILAKLGYVEVIRYVKERETWRWLGAVIAVDKLEFGDFVDVGNICKPLAPVNVTKSRFRRRGAQAEQNKSASLRRLEASRYGGPKCRVVG